MVKTVVERRQQNKKKKPKKKEVCIKLVGCECSNKTFVVNKASLSLTLLALFTFFNETAQKK